MREVKITDKITLIHGDCMDYLAGCSDGEFDLAVVDPPYGIGEDGGEKHKAKPNGSWRNPKPKGYAKKSWDKEPPSCGYFIELKRASKHQIIWGANHFVDRIPNAGSPCWIAWYKAGQNPNTCFADGELAWGSFKSAVKFIDIPWLGFGAVNLKEHRIHPTQKPVKLYDWIYANYAKPGQRVIDTHLGSGSNAIAAHYAGMEFVGIELDEDYFNAAVERVRNEIKQEALF